MFFDNKYTKYYYNIISAAVTQHRNKKDAYYENHHIIPKCLGGSNAPNNLVLLTAREHFICHLLLTKMSDYQGLKIALICMLNDVRFKIRYTPRQSKIYEYCRQQASLSKTGKNNPMYGRARELTPDQRANLSNGLKNSQKLKDSRASAEYRTKISDVQSNTVLLISADSGRILSEWKNCRELADFLECTYANIKNARRDKRIVGTRIKKLQEKCYVVYAKDFQHE